MKRKGSVYNAHLDFRGKICAKKCALYMGKYGMRFFQKQGIFHYFRAFKTEIFHIYSLIGQILKQLSPLVSVTSIGYLPRDTVAQ